MVKKNKLVYGVGINDADYSVHKYEMRNGKRKQAWICPYYVKWKDMLVRGYSEKFKERRPSYKDVTICDKWHIFSNFKSWMEQQDWEGKELDKDILYLGNKEYSPERCVFVDAIVNSFIIDRSADRGECPIGVCKNRKYYQALCSSPFTKKQEHLGYYDTPEEAHAAWLKRKQELAVELAAIQSDERVAKALIDRYFNYTEDAP